MIKSFSILFFILLSCSFGYSQKVDSLIIEATELQNSGYYKQAIAKYKEALLIDSKSPTINYQIAYNYLLLQDYRSSIKFCDKVIRANSQKVIEAYILKGSSLDYRGKQSQSIKLYKNAIKKYPNNYLLYFNLGITYHNNNQINEAETQYLKAIEINNLHPGSHLMLGLLMNDRSYRVRSMLSLYFFLLLEPDTERSVEAYQLLQKLWTQNIETNPSDSAEIKIHLNPKSDENPLNTLDLSISLIASSNFKQGSEGLNKYELFTNNTASFFSLLGELKASKDKDIWAGLYASFFNDLLAENLVEPFCYYISTTCDDEFINGWLESNRYKIELFSNWVNQRLNPNSALENAESIKKL